MLLGPDDDEVRPQVARDQTMVHSFEQLRAEQRAKVAITGSGELSSSWT
jgi:hypothetical protein